MIPDRFMRPNTYAVWSKDKNTRFTSTSGGAFSEIATAIVKKGGVVAGARYNEKCMVEHCLIDSLSGIEEIRQSKYLSSSLGDIYLSVKKLLEEGEIVCFSGAPCQIKGLYAFLGRDYEKLYTIDFICRGMNSPKAYRAWLDEIENQEGSKVKKVWFKYKEGGWKTSPRRTRIDFCDGHYVIIEGEKNAYMHGYLTSNLYMRPSCGKCSVKGFPRQADITLADFWGIEKDLDDDMGTSMLLLNSNKGRELFYEVQDSLIVHEKDFDTVFDGNPMLLKSAVVPKEAHDFLISLDMVSFSDALKKYGVYSKTDTISRLLENVKRAC